MKLYRHELGSDDDAEDVIARKRLVADFEDREAIYEHIRTFYAPVVITVESDQAIDDFEVLVGLPADTNIEPRDEALWLIGLLPES